MDIWLGGDSLDNVYGVCKLRQQLPFQVFSSVTCSHVQDKTSKQLAVLWLTRNLLVKEASYAKDSLKLVVGTKCSHPTLAYYIQDRM